MRLQKFKKLKFPNLTFLGISLGLLLFSYLTLGNPEIENKIPGMIILFSGTIILFFGVYKGNTKNRDFTLGCFKTLLIMLITLYLTLFFVYLIAGFIKI